ncbi:MAG: DUF3109 family protein [Flavobacteriales bacterium]|nr:DUF3109 family protein [Flavobacteriales bacterium]
MIEHRGTLISEDLFERRFVCDLNACKGACCVAGSSGAPLEVEEEALLQELWPKIRPYIPEKGQRAIDEHGVSELDEDGDLVTTLVEGRGECAFTVFDEQGIALCGVERAWKDGAIPFRKPISCHLYPIRIEKLKFHDGLNYHRWPICKPACECGAKLDVPVFRFLKDSLTRKYGAEWYAELEEIHAVWVADGRGQ